MNTGETNQQIFERLGVDKVRLLVKTNGLAPQMITEAISWLAQIDRDERLRNESSQALQMRTALSAQKAAWIAAIAAIIATIFALISIVIALK